MDTSNVFSIFQIFIVLITGAVLGSFCSAIIHRISNGQSWIVGHDMKAARSSCPQCHHVLHAKDLVPFLSWILLRGRCRYCQAQISVLYPLLEVGAIFAVWVIYLFFGFSLTGVLLIALIPFIMAQGVLFFRSRIFSLQLFVIITCFLCVIAAYSIFGL